MGSPKNMSDELFNVILTGQIIDGFQRDGAVSGLSEFLRTSSAQANSLLNDKSKIVVKAIARDRAMKFKLKLASIGVVARIQKVSQKAKNDLPASGLQKKAKVVPISRVNDKRKSADQLEPDSPENSKTDNDPPSAQIKNAFDGVVQGETVALAEQLSLLGVTCLVIVLTMIYLGLVAYLAVFGLGHLAGGLSTGFVGFLSLHLVPSLLVFVLVLFLLRPILSSPKVSRNTIPLGKNERSLVHFIGHMAGMLGAPKPNSIVFTDDKAITAEFSGGLKGLREIQVEMRLGLPVMMILDIRTFIGAVAGTLGRFDDSTGMYMQFAVREINRRLTASCFEGDQWRAKVDQLKLSRSKFINQYVYGFFHYGLWVSSRLLRPVMMLVRVLTAANSRRFTRRSDFWFTSVSGTPAFVDFFRSMTLLDQALEETEKDVRSAVKEQKYVNNILAMMSHAFKTQPESKMHSVADEVVEHSTEWSELMPSNRDRIMLAEDRKLPGIVVLEGEAYRLIKGFKSVSEQFSLNYYHQRGIQVDAKALVATRDVTFSNSKDKLREEMCNRYYNGWFEPEFFWQMNHYSYAKSISKQRCSIELNECIKVLRRSSPDFIALKIEVPECFQKYLQTRLATEIHKAGYRWEKELPGLEGVTVYSLTTTHNSHRRDYESRRAHQRDFCRVMGERLCLAVALLEDEREIKVAERIMNMLSLLERQAHKLEMLRVHVDLAPIYLERIKNKNESEHIKRIRRLGRDIFTAYELAMSEFARLNWPFSTEHENLADFIGGFIHELVRDQQEVSGLPAVDILEERIELYEALCFGMTQANAFLNGKVVPLAQKCEQTNNITRIKAAIGKGRVG